MLCGGVPAVPCCAHPCVFPQISAPRVSARDRADSGRCSDALLLPLPICRPPPVRAVRAPLFHSAGTPFRLRRSWAPPSASVVLLAAPAPKITTGPAPSPLMFGSSVLRSATEALSPSIRKLQLKEIQAQVFQSQFNPSGERCGSKYLRERPIGAAILPYYGTHYQSRKTWNMFTSYLNTERDVPFLLPPDSDLTPAQVRANMEESWRRRRMAKFGGLGLKPTEPYQDDKGVWRVENKFISDQEKTRFITLDRKRRLGKGHPKKGTSSRLTLTRVIALTNPTVLTHSPGQNDKKKKR